MSSGRKPHSDSASEILAKAGQRLKLVRELLDLTQTAAGRPYGLSQAAWSKIEGGTRPLELYHAVNVAADWGITLDFIYAGKIVSMVESDIAANVAILRPDLVVRPSVAQLVQEQPYQHRPSKVSGRVS